MYYIESKKKKRMYILKLTINSSRDYTKRHQDIYVVRREEVPYNSRVATNHY